jgi:hypothetical protein
MVTAPGFFFAWSISSLAVLAAGLEHASAMGFMKMKTA